MIRWSVRNPSCLSEPIDPSARQGGTETALKAGRGRLSAGGSGWRKSSGSSCDLSESLNQPNAVPAISRYLMLAHLKERDAVNHSLVFRSPGTFISFGRG